MAKAEAEAEAKAKAEGGWGGSMWGFMGLRSCMVGWRGLMLGLSEYGFFLLFWSCDFSWIRLLWGQGAKEVGYSLDGVLFSFLSSFSCDSLLLGGLEGCEDVAANASARLRFCGVSRG